MPYSRLSLVACVLLLAYHVEAARNVFGSCPQVEPMKDFDMERFAGFWHVMECFDTAKCMTWNITRLTDTKYHLVESKLSGTKVYNGKLHTNAENTGALKINWAINVGGRYPFTVHDTDYETYASVFLCQKVLFYTRQNGVTLSRGPVMPISLRQQTTGKLQKFDVEMSYFRKVDQGASCPKDGDTSSKGKPGNVQGTEYLGDFGSLDIFGSEDPVDN